LDSVEVLDGCFKAANPMFPLSGHGRPL